MNPLTPEPALEYITPEEIAQRLGITLPTVYNMIKAKEIPGVLRAVRPMRISRGAFERWLKGDESSRESST